MSMYAAIREFVSRHERKISSLALISGFIIDSLTLQRIDKLFENIILSTYILCAGAGIILLNALEERRIERGHRLYTLKRLLPIGIQFFFGGLFSGFLVFYFRSAAFSVSWPFILVLASLLVCNELLRKQYERAVFQIGIFFFCILSFSIFAVPIIAKSMGVLIFIASGAASVIVIAVFIVLLFIAAPKTTKDIYRTAVPVIGGIYAVVTVLYFFNAIPPIPLSVKEAGMYQSVRREGGEYILTAFDRTASEWLNIFERYPDITVESGKPVYAYSAVFAPTELETGIVHRWQYYDPSRKAWVNKARISFSIIGGRDGGYRGYSASSQIIPGYWRVNIETERGQVVGRIKFQAVEK